MLPVSIARAARPAPCMQPVVLCRNPTTAAAAHSSPSTKLWCEVPTSLAQPSRSGRPPQALGRHRGHYPLGQATLPGLQLAGARSQPHDQPDRRFSGDDQLVTNSPVRAADPLRHSRTAALSSRVATKPWSHPGNALLCRVCRSYATCLPAGCGAWTTFRLLKYRFVRRG